MFALVYVDMKNQQLNRSFEYIIPKHLESVVEIGHRVYVPFGKLKLLGFVVDITTTSEFDSTKLKEIIDVLDIKPLISKELLDLAYFISSYYFTFMVNALELMIPSALKVNYTRMISVINYDLLSDDLKLIFENKKELSYELLKEHIKEVKKEVSNNNLEIIDIVKDKAKKDVCQMVKLIDHTYNPTSKKQEQLLNYLKEINDIVLKSFLINDLNFSQSVISTLVSKNVLEIELVDTYNNIINNENKTIVNHEMNNYQKEAFNSIKESFNTFSEYLLFGVTGSGKTLVYLNLIDEVIKNNKEAILLVPEISLTPQMVNLVHSRFLDNVAIIHSGLTIKEKYNEWRKIYDNKVKIVVGARSAIFAPFCNLGIIIVDEMHEQSYIQDSNPRYDALEIAKRRAKYHNCPVVYASATPLVTYYYKALNNEIKLLELPKRVNNQIMPLTKVVDIKEELKKKNKWVLSRELIERIKEKLILDEQIIIFLNKRGFSSYLTCLDCGEVIKCKNCDVSMTYHKNSNKLKCHYCGYERPNDNICPSCAGTNIKYLGTGTQKILEEVNTLFPEARSIVVDTDTTSKKNELERLLNEFKDKKASILIGTQMIAKGLDFPNVTLVGIINADISLRFPSYDSFEKTFNILEQVSGRCGRSNKIGEVYLQTYSPTNYAISCASKHDYVSFYTEEIKNRKLLFNPPFSQIVMLTISSADLIKAKKEAYIILGNLLDNDNIKTYGPTSDFIFKLNEKYRYNIMIKFKDDSLEILNNLVFLYQNKKDVTLKIVRL